MAALEYTAPYADLRNTPARKTKKVRLYSRLQNHQPAPATHHIDPASTGGMCELQDSQSNVTTQLCAI